MKPINGVYVGWIPPHSHLWEPLYRTVRCDGGYQSQQTKAYTDAIARYPGLKGGLDFRADPLDLPYALSRRTPKVRTDYEQTARLLGLPYPILDLFEYIGRTGGLFSGDSFTVCPVVAPDDNGSYSYSYECVLSGVDPVIRDSLSPDTKLGVAPQLDNATIITADGLFLGRLSPHFSPLYAEIFNPNILKVGQQETIIGSQIVVSFDTPVNLYLAPAFAVVNQEAIVSV